MRNRASSSGAPVVFAGERRDVPEILGLFDVAALTSLWEGLPYTILEAMASGTPVVCTDIPIFAEIAGAGSGASLYPAGDADAFAQALVGVLGDPAKASEMAASGLALVRERYSVEVSCSATVEVYERLFGGART